MPITGLQMKIKDIITEIENICPPQLAQDWDNVGLLVGNADRPAKNPLMTIDITRDVLQEAKNLKSNFIISYHPVIWNGLKSVTAGSIIYDLIRSNISVYSIHTSLDVIPGGVNDNLAEMLGIVDPQPIGDFVQASTDDNYKLVVFIPAENVNDVSNAIFAAGAGSMGNYSHCGFNSHGIGTFIPLEGANPAIGTIDKPERLNEVKFETIVPGKYITQAVQAMRDNHPYEEPAFDVIRLSDVENTFGLGRMGELEKPTKVEKLLENIKKTTSAKSAGIIGDPNKTVKKAAVCAGSCGKILFQIIASNCDLYLTGELKHHEALAAQEAGLTVICLSHSVSERFMLKKLAKILKKPLNNIKFNISKSDKDPFVWKQI